MGSRSGIVCFLVLALILSTSGALPTQGTEGEATLAGFDHVYISNGVVTAGLGAAEVGPYNIMWSYDTRLVLSDWSPEKFAIGNGSQAHIFRSDDVREGFSVANGVTDQWYGSDLLLDVPGTPRLGVDREIMVPTNGSYLFINYRVTNEDAAPLINGSLYQLFNFDLSGTAVADEGGYLPDIDSMVNYDPSIGMYGGFRCISANSSKHGAYMDIADSTVAEGEMEACALNNETAWLLPVNYTKNFRGVIEVSLPPILNPGESYVITFKLAFAYDLEELRTLLKTKPQFEKVHDVSVIDARPLKPMGSRGRTMLFSATVCNNGNFTESLNLTLLGGSRALGKKMVSDLAPGETREITFFIPNIGFLPFSTIIGSLIDPVQGETDLLDNFYQDFDVGHFQLSGIGYVIIVAGDRYGLLRSEIHDAAGRTYNILRSAGFDRDRICFMGHSSYIGHDFDGDGLPDIVLEANSTNFQWAIEEWAADRVGPGEPLFVFLHDHGGLNTFVINKPDCLSATDLSNYFSNLESATYASIHLVYSACVSGSFIDEISEDGRVVIASCIANQSSYCIDQFEPFQHYFWQEVGFGYCLKECFNYACEVMHDIPLWGKTLFDFQTPLLDDNGDQMGHTGPLVSEGDGELATNTYIGACEWYYPWISEASSKLTLDWYDLPDSVDLWARVKNASSLVNVTACLVPLDWEPNATDESLGQIPTELFKMEDHDGVWNVSIPMTNFTAQTSGPNNFTILIMAEEENGMISAYHPIRVELAESGVGSPDDSAPRVRLRYPLNETMVNGVIEVNGTISDDVCVDRVELYVNGELHASQGLPGYSTCYYEFPVDTTAYGNGSLELMVRGYDTSNNSRSDAATVYLNNGVHEAVVTWIAPDVHGVFQGQPVDVKVGVANHGAYQETMEITLWGNNVLLGSKSVPISPLSYQEVGFLWDTSGLIAGDYALTARVAKLSGELDDSNNELTSGEGVTIMDLAPSNITMAANPSSVILGSEVLIDGVLDPAKEGAEIDIWSRLDGGSWSVMASVQIDIDGMFGHVWTPVSLGIHDIKASWEGDAETLAAESETLTITVTTTPSDTVAPNTTLELSGTGGDDGWFVSQVNVTFTATDTLSGVNWTEYSYDKLTWSVYSAPFDVSVEGITELHYRSMDMAGNLEQTWTSLIKIDLAPPTGGIRVQDGAVYTTSANVTMSFNATDNASGVHQFRLSNDALIWDEWTTFNASQSWQLSSGDGQKSVFAQFRDRSGHESATYHADITLDTVAPNTTLELSGTGGDDGWFVSQVTVILTATDHVGGVNWTEYSFDGLTWSVYSAPFDVSTEGTTELHYRSMDMAGNLEQTKLESIRTDWTLPNGSIEIQEGADYTTTVTVTVSLNATDIVSGIHQFRLSNDEVDWSSWSALVDTQDWQLSSGDGQKSVFAQFRDRAGHLSMVCNASITFDPTAPVADAGEDRAITVGQTVQLDGSGSSDLNGIPSYIWQFNDGSLMTLTGMAPTYQFNTVGSFVITLNVTDAAGNWATDTVVVTVQGEGDGGDMGILPYALLLLAAAVTVVLVWTYLRRRA